MSKQLYENGIQGMFWFDGSDSMGFCALDDPQVQTIGVQVPMHFGYCVNFNMNCDRLGFVDPELGQRRFDNALEAARLFVAAPELLTALEEMVSAYAGDRQMSAEDCLSAYDRARAAIAKAKGGE